MKERYNNLNICQNCGFKSDREINFCPECGTSLGGIKSKLTGMKKRLEFNVQEKISQVKSSLDKRISKYLLKLDSNEEVRIGNMTIPENRRETVRNALLGFQSRFGTEDAEISQEFNQWLEDLHSRLDDEKCIVCFQKWTSSIDTVVICKHCRSGGHQSHLFGWVEDKKLCPLCRQNLLKRDLIPINLSN